MITRSWISSPTSGKLASSPLPPPFDWNFATDCAGTPQLFQCRVSPPSLSPFPWDTSVLCHTDMMLLQLALWGECDSHTTQITEICTENVLFISNWSKAKRKYTLAALEQFTCSDASPDQVLSVDRINKVHCYEPQYRIPMPWFKQLLVTWDTTAADAVTVEHLAVTQQHQHTAMQCTSQSFGHLEKAAGFLPVHLAIPLPVTITGAWYSKAPSILASFFIQ